MALGWPSLILLLFACRYATSAYITPEVAAFIPICAQQCFKSFLANNFGSFPDERCGGSPSLECLCTSKSTSGYTIGEGAVQCLISEDNIGFCQGSSASNAVVANAYGMCDGVQNAIPRTHGTLTATLVVQTGTSSVLLIAPGVTTSISAVLSGLTTTSSASSTPTTAIVRTSASLSASNLATTSSIVRTSSSSSVRALTSSTLLPTASIVRTTSAPASGSTEALTSSSSSALAATNTGAVAGNSLSKGQIAGISGGLAGGFSAFLVLALLMLCLRRRKARSARRRDSDAMPFQVEPPPVVGQVHPRKKKSFYQSRVRNGDEAIVGPGPTRNGVATRVASPTIPALPPQIPKREEPSDPYIFSRRSMRPDTIGMAFSPEAKTPEAERRPPSKLLPEKPTLKLTVPPSREKQGNGLSFSQPVAQTVGGAGRQSTATQFEEDMDTADTAVNSEDTWSRISSDGMLRSADYGRAPQYSEREQVDPHSHQALQTGGLYMESLIRAQDRNNHPQSRNVPPTRTLLRGGHLSAGALSNYSDSKSVYSDDGLKPPVPPIPQNAYHQPGPYDREATDFIVSPEDYEDPRTAGPRIGNTTDLSPVMESPTSGKSPVSYPKIPEAISPTILSMHYGPPPPQPNFMRGKDSPTTGMPTEQPWRGAEIRAQQKRQEYARLQADLHAQAQAQAQTQARSQPPRTATANEHVPKRPKERFNAPDFSNSPRVRDVNPTGQQQFPLSFHTNPFEKAHTPPPRSQTAPLTDATGSTGWNSNPYDTGYQSLSQPRSQPQLRNQYQPQYQTQRPQLSPKQRTFPPSQTQAQVEKPNTASSTTLPTSQNPFSEPEPTYTTPISHPPQAHLHPSTLPIPNHALKRTPSSLSQNSANSTSSSLLLQKRLGPQKALALCLRPEEMNEGRKRQQAKWRVLDAQPHSNTHAHMQNEDHNRGRRGSTDKEEWEIFDEGVDLGDEHEREEKDERSEMGTEGEGKSEVGGVRLQFVTEKENRDDDGEGRHGREFERMELPQTPGWVPRLTPTRRGDVLFLNVA